MMADDASVLGTLSESMQEFMHAVEKNPEGKTARESPSRTGQVRCRTAAYARYLYDSPSSHLCRYSFWMSESMAFLMSETLALNH